MPRVRIHPPRPSAGRAWLLATAAVLLGLDAAAAEPAPRLPPATPDRDAAVTYRTAPGDTVRDGAAEGALRVSWLAAEGAMRVDLPDGGYMLFLGRAAGDGGRTIVVSPRDRAAVEMPRGFLPPIGHAPGARMIREA